MDELQKFSQINSDENVYYYDSNSDDEDDKQFVFFTFIIRWNQSESY